MATHLRIHLGKERELYEHPPLVPAAEQARVFTAPDWADAHLLRMLAPANHVGFLLQLGYFQISQRFYVATRYHAADIAYVAQQVGLGADDFAAARFIMPTSSSSVSNWASAGSRRPPQTGSTRRPCA
ncbi:DUF4158 domain-containing protein [Hymenobacter sp. PAMC 26628]|uniref:DUF4158 domain-containing protein n=1 Tax=Hymenobacter sp. PAMC 26628 TaxID=1484118 RepID=UPI0007703CF9|nr:DUF4158 domain-containing protein [Hymenobacter sp. PAMC 26628]AMJ67738.1 hypothetical protein AXW84_21685 [Hymenobacter sp. PAMC 26628]